MCPYEEFERTKHDVGPCPLLHDEELRADWQVGHAACSVASNLCASALHIAYMRLGTPSLLQFLISICLLQVLGWITLHACTCTQALDDKSKERLGFERELYKYLDKLMVELQAKIHRNSDRLAAEEAAPLPPADQVGALHAHRLLSWP